MNASEAKSIAAVLKSGNESQLRRLLKECESERKMDLLLEIIVKTCGKSDEAPLLLHPTFLPALGRHFSTLTSLAAYNQGTELMTMLRLNQSQSARTIATLLMLLVQNSQVLNATRVREELVKGELVELHRELAVTGRDEEMAASLAICIYSTLALEASYAPNPDREHWSRIGKLWDSCVESAESSIVAQLCTLLLHSLLRTHVKQRRLEGCGESEERVEAAERAIFRGGLLASLTADLNSISDRRDCYASVPSLVFELLLPNIATFHSRLSTKRFRRLVKFLVGAALHFSRTAELKAHFTRLISCGDTGRCELLETLLREEMEPHGLWGIPGAFKSASASTRFDALDKWLQTVSTKQLNAVVASLIDGAEGSDTDTIAGVGQLASQQGLDLFDLLENFAERRKEFRVEFTRPLACHMLKEGDLPVRSLKLAAAMLKMHHGNLPTLNALVSFSLSLCRPVAHKFFEGEAADGVDAYVLAKARLLIAALKHAPMVVRSRVPVVCGLVPDLFHQLSIYWEEGTDSYRHQAERLEHALVCLCKEIENEKSAFHRHIPFVVSNSMTGERAMSYPMFILLSICDNHDMALIATNFPPKEKRKFAMLQTQFYAANKIVG